MIGGPGYPLPYPSIGFPLANIVASPKPPTNRFYLPAGMVWTVPPGWQLIWSSGTNTAVQVLDPVSGQWYPTVAAAGFTLLNSDGSNYRVSNLSGMPIGSAVTGAGSGYVQSTTTVTSGAGGSTWRPIIGGAVNATLTIGADSKGNVGGTNWTYAPLLFVQAPPPGGIQATASATVSAGAINAVTLRNAGAGYTAAPLVLVVPNPLDPNLGKITIPVITTTVTGAGTLTAVILVNPGTPQGSAPTLTVSGAGSAATATATMFNTTAAADTIFAQYLGGAS